MDSYSFINGGNNYVEFFGIIKIYLNACMDHNYSIRLEFGGVWEKIKKDLLQPSSVESKDREHLLQKTVVKFDGQCTLFQSHTHQVHDFQYCLIGRRISVLRLELTVLDISQIKKVISIEHGHLTWDQDQLGLLFQILLSQVLGQTLCKLDIVSQRNQHLMVDWSRVCCDLSVLFLLLLQIFISRDVCEIEHCAILVV